MAGVIGIDDGTSLITNALPMNKPANNELTNHQDSN